MAKTKVNPIAEAKRLQGQARGVIDDVAALVEELEAKAEKLADLAVEHGRALVTERVDGADPERIPEIKMRDAADILHSFGGRWRKYHRHVTEAGHLK